MILWGMESSLLDRLLSMIKNSQIASAAARLAKNNTAETQI